MTLDPFVALLRGINVGGHRRLPMAELRSALEVAGFGGVRTYIQSGNVVFDRPAVDTDEEGVAASIRTVIADSCGMAVPVLVRPLGEIERVVAAHPGVGGDVPDKWLHVFFLDRAVDHAVGPDPEKFSPDRWVLQGREVFVTYPTGSGRSKLTIDVFERSFDVTATARNLTTLAAIVALGRRQG